MDEKHEVPYWEIFYLHLLNVGTLYKGKSLRWNRYARHFYSDESGATNAQMSFSISFGNALAHLLVDSGEIMK
jgi:hypothetical protein